MSLLLDTGTGGPLLGPRSRSGGRAGGRRGEQGAGVDLELLPGDVAGGVGGQEQDRLGDVAGVPPSGAIPAWAITMSSLPSSPTRAPAPRAAARRCGRRPGWR